MLRDCSSAFRMRLDSSNSCCSMLIRTPTQGYSSDRMGAVQIESTDNRVTEASAASQRDKKVDQPDQEDDRNDHAGDLHEWRRQGDHSQNPPDHAKDDAHD